MTDTVPLRSYETHHALSAAESEIERAMFANLQPRPASSIDTLRRGYDQMIAETPIVDGLALEAVDRDGVHGWWIRPANAPADRAILFLHGGGYMLGSAQAYRGLASQ